MYPCDLGYYAILCMQYWGGKLGCDIGYYAIFGYDIRDGALGISKPPTIAILS